MMTKTIIILVIFVGIIFMTISLVKNDQQCPVQQTIYKYIPRTFEEEQNEPVYVTDIFSTMFSQQSPWVKSMNDVDYRKTEAINKYFVSQY
jgi:hypothetical protein